MFVQKADCTQSPELIGGRPQDASRISSNTIMKGVEGYIGSKHKPRISPWAVYAYSRLPKVRMWTQEDLCWVSFFSGNRG